MAQLQDSTNNLLNWLLGRKSRPLDDEPAYVFDGFRRQFKSAYQLFPRGTARRIVRPTRLTLSRGTNDVVRAVVKHFRIFEKYFAEVVVHGSVATGETVPNWSDLDIIAVLKDEVFETTDSLLAARQALHQAEEWLPKFDRWQHHGIQVITEADLRYYPESFLPLVVWRRGVALYGKQPLQFWLRDSKEESERRFNSIVLLCAEAARTGEFKHHGQGGVYLKENGANKQQTFYQFKYFVSVMLLLPSLWLELVEGPIFKKDSFEKIARYFTERELELVRACEQVRSLAPRVRLTGEVIPVAMLTKLGPNYFSRAASLTRLMWRRYENR